MVLKTFFGAGTIMSTASANSTENFGWVKSYDEVHLLLLFDVDCQNKMEKVIPDLVYLSTCVTICFCVTQWFLTFFTFMYH